MGIQENRSQQDKYAEYTDVYVETRDKQPHTRIYLKYIQSEVRELLPDDANLTVLDNMCGAGHATEDLLKVYSNVYMADLSSDMLKKAVLRLGKSSCRRMIAADALYLPYRENSFDLVVVNGALHHILDLKPAFSEVRRILKDDGYFVFLEPCDDFFLLRVLRRLIYIISPQLDAKNEKALTTRQVSNLAKQTGFNVVEIKQIGYVGYGILYNNDVLPFFKKLKHFKNIEKISNAICSLDRRLSDTPLLKKTGLVLKAKLQKNSFADK